MKVIVESYKPTGKYYATGEYETDKVELYQIFEEVAVMAKKGNIPGLRFDSAWSRGPLTQDWILRVTCPSHKHEHPTLIPLWRDRYGKRILPHERATNEQPH